MTVAVVAGFVPLVDAALLVLAREEGFAEAEGLDLSLVREGSWAAVRDKLTVGLFDAAHMLAPAAVAATLGLGHLKTPLAAAVGLGANGNAIAVSREIATGLRARIGARSGPVGPARTAAAFGELAADRARSGLPPFTAAAVFSHSCHLLLLRRWLSLGGLDPDRAVATVVLPPPLTAEALTAGRIDLFCAGAPWSAVAQARGAGRLLHTGPEIIPDLPEKWLVVHADRRREPWVGALRRAVLRAADFLADPAAIPIAARHLARPDYLGQPAPMIEDALRGRRIGLFDHADAPPDPAFLRFDRAALRAGPEAVRRIVELMAEAGQIPDPEAADRAVEAIAAAAEEGGG